MIEQPFTRASVSSTDQATAVPLITLLLAANLRHSAIKLYATVHSSAEMAYAMTTTASAMLRPKSSCRRLPSAAIKHNWSMRIALLRHGRAADRETWVGVDAQRPLTKEGIARCRILCDHYARLFPCEQICTSPLLRARQTAEIAATLWRVPVREVSALALGAASPEVCSERLNELAARALVIVGHEPDLSTLAHHLCGGHFDLRKGGMIILEGDLIAHGMTCLSHFAPRHILTVASPQLAGQ